MRDIVTVEGIHTFLGDQKKYRLTVRLPRGWRIEADVQMYRRWRLFVLGGGLHLGEPWGEQGSLWACNVRVYAFGASLGVRGPAPEPAPIDWDDDDLEAPNDPS